MMNNHLLKYGFTCLCVLAGLFLFEACTQEAGTSDAPFSDWLTGSEFQTEFDNQLAASKYPAEIQGREVDGVLELRAVFVSFTEPFAFSAFTELTEEEFATENASLTSAGYALQHWSQVAFSSTKLFTAVWTDTSGPTDKLIDVSVSADPCLAVATANNGISIGLLPNGECLIAETTDRAACRATDNYANCAGLSGVASINFLTACPGGITQGSTAYLPSSLEASLFQNITGSGSPVSSNGFCVANSGACAANGTNVPYEYIRAFDDTSFGISSVNNLPLSGVFGGHSVRCVMSIAP